MTKRKAHIRLLGDQRVAGKYLAFAKQKLAQLRRSCVEGGRRYLSRVYAQNKGDERVQVFIEAWDTIPGSIVIRAKVSAAIGGIFGPHGGSERLWEADLYRAAFGERTNATSRVTFDSAGSAYTVNVVAAPAAIISAADIELLGVRTFNGMPQEALTRLRALTDTPFIRNLKFVEKLSEWAEAVDGFGPYQLSQLYKQDTATTSIAFSENSPLVETDDGWLIYANTPYDLTFDTMQAATVLARPDPITSVNELLNDQEIVSYPVPGYPAASTFWKATLGGGSSSHFLAEVLTVEAGWLGELSPVEYPTEAECQAAIPALIAFWSGAPFFFTVIDSRCREVITGGGPSLFEYDHAEPDWVEHAYQAGGIPIFTGTVGEQGSQVTAVGTITYPVTALNPSDVVAIDLNTEFSMGGTNPWSQVSGDKIIDDLNPTRDNDGMRPSTAPPTTPFSAHRKMTVIRKEGVLLLDKLQGSEQTRQDNQAAGTYITVGLVTDTYDFTLTYSVLDVTWNTAGAISTAPATFTERTVLGTQSLDNDGETIAIDTGIIIHQSDDTVVIIDEDVGVQRMARSSDRYAEATAYTHDQESYQGIAVGTDTDVETGGVSTVNDTLVEVYRANNSASSHFPGPTTTGWTQDIFINDTDYGLHRFETINIESPAQKKAYANGVEISPTISDAAIEFLDVFKGVNYTQDARFEVGIGVEGTITRTLNVQEAVSGDPNPVITATITGDVIGSITWKWPDGLDGITTNRWSFEPLFDNSTLDWFVPNVGCTTQLLAGIIVGARSTARPLLQRSVDQFAFRTSPERGARIERGVGMPLRNVLSIYAPELEGMCLVYRTSNFITQRDLWLAVANDPAKTEEEVQTQYDAMDAEQFVLWNDCAPKEVIDGLNSGTYFIL